ncbi:hypothetical protein MHEI_45230 [Mycobacterium heidelbergense]|nr:hypothetical protein MHEI_45230 [Mycobacterium heidelbergense]
MKILAKRQESRGAIGPVWRTGVMRLERPSGTGGAGRRVTAAKLTAATIPAWTGDSKWSPAPTAGRDRFPRLSGPVTGTCLFRARRGRLDWFQAAIGRHWALLCRAFLLVCGVPPLTLRWAWALAATGERQKPNKAQQGRPHQH